MSDLELVGVLEVLLEVDGGCSDCAREAIVELTKRLKLERENVALALEVIGEEQGSTRPKRIADWLRSVVLDGLA